MRACRPLLVLCVVAPLAIGGCDDGPADGGVQPSAGAARGSDETAPRSPLALPAGVPTAAAPGETAPATHRRVINAWLRAVREGDIDRAAGYFAEPSTVQNGTPVLTLTSKAAREEFSGSLPCGAFATGYGYADGYVIVEFELTERRGGDCMGAAGRSARGAIKVEGRRITEWYRLPGASGGAPLPPDVGDLV